MNISPNEAEEALQAIRLVTQKTRHSIASSNVHISLITTGAVWLIGFLCTQFLSGQVLVSIWVGLSLLGGALATILSLRKSKRIHSPSAPATARRIALVWLLLAIYCIAAIAVAWPLDGKQLTMFIVLFVMIAWSAMGLLLSFASVWPGLILIALMLICYFLLPGFFYLWMGLLGGGGLIFLGLYIRYRW